MEDTSVVLAWNLGVVTRERKGYPGDLESATNEMRAIILMNLPNVGFFPWSIVKASLEFYLNIAMLGYVMPLVAGKDTELKQRVFAVLGISSQPPAPFMSEELRPGVRH